MKRYFAVVPKERSAQKRAKACASIPCTRKDPLSFVSWNVNGLSPRARSAEWKNFVAFVKELDADVVSIQEVRLPAKGECMRSKVSLGRNKKETEEFKTVKERVRLKFVFGIWKVITRKYSSAILDNIVHISVLHLKNTPGLPSWCTNGCKSHK